MSVCVYPRMSVYTAVSALSYNREQNFVYGIPLRRFGLTCDENASDDDVILFTCPPTRVGGALRHPNCALQQHSNETTSAR